MRLRKPIAIIIVVIHMVGCAGSVKEPVMPVAEAVEKQEPQLYTVNFKKEAKNEDKTGQTSEPRPNSYIQSSIGKTEIQNTIAKDALTFRPIKSWVGEHIIFLPSLKTIDPYMKILLGSRKYRLSKPKLAMNYRISENFTLDYDEYVGRIARVLSVREPEDYLRIWVIEIEMVDSKKRFTITSSIGFGEVFLHFALVADIDNARNRYLGKTLWNIKNKIYTYNEATGKRGAVELKKYSPLKVINIVAGFSNRCPVRFVLQTNSGEEGYIDVNMSGTNVGEIERNKMRFYDLFLTQDPRIMHKWPDEVWSKIETGTVFIGMTTEQAEMSWGKPEDKNATVTAGSISEQWVYGSGNYIYFVDGLLTSIQQ